MQKITAQVLAVKFVKAMIGGNVYNINDKNCFDSDEPKIWSNTQSEYDIVIKIKKIKDADVGVVSCYIKGFDFPFWVIPLDVFIEWNEECYQLCQDKTKLKEERTAGWIALAERISKESFQPSFKRFTYTINNYLNNPKASKKKKQPKWPYILVFIGCIVSGVYWYAQEHYLNLIALPVGVAYISYKWRKNEEIEDSEDPFEDLHEHLADKTNDEIVNLLDSLE